MFATGLLARRIEGAEASIVRDAGAAAARRSPDGYAFVIPIRGGIAAFTEPESPINKVTALGFGGVPDEERLRRSGIDSPRRHGGGVTWPS